MLKSGSVCALVESGLKGHREGVWGWRGGGGEGGVGAGKGGRRVGVTGWARRGMGWRGGGEEGVERREGG